MNSKNIHDYENHICSIESASCMYCISHVQQTYQVAKLLQSSYQTYNNSRCHYELLSTSSQGATVAPRFIAAASSSLNTIAQYQIIQPNFQSREKQGQMQTLLLRLSLRDTSSEKQKGSDSLTIEPTDKEDPSLILKTQYFEQESQLQSVSDQVSVCNKLTEKLSDINVDNTIQSNKLLFISSPPKAHTQSPPTATLRSSRLTHVHKDRSRKDDPRTQKADKEKDYKQLKCQCPNCSEEGGNKSRDSDGKLQHMCHISYCKKVFGRPWRLRKHLLEVHSDEKNSYSVDCDYDENQLSSHARVHKAGKSRRKCQFPNCNAEGGNKTEGPNGKPLYVCLIAGCKKNFAWKHSLKRHLEWHKGKKNFFCAYCEEGFQCKFNLKSHITRHINGLKITKRTRCQCQYCSVEGGNKTSSAVRVDSKDALALNNSSDQPIFIGVEPKSFL